MARQAFPIVLSAPGGTGKTTLIHLLLDSMPNLQMSVSYTTRPHRAHEKDGFDYHFISESLFKSMVEKGEFLEWARVHEHFYGSSLHVIEEAFSNKKDVLFDIDVHGALQIKKKVPQTILIFILPPSLGILEERLRSRATDAEEFIQKRLRRAREEITLGLAHYDYVINNETLDRALFDLMAIIRTHRLLGFDREKVRKRLLGD